MFFDSLLKGLNCWYCWRSRWSASRWGWFSIFWIKSRTLAPCNCFTAECGNPGMLKSMSSSLIARLNSLSVLNDAMSRFSSGANCFFTVCALELFRSSGCPDPSWVCSTRVFSDRLSGFPDRSEEPSSSCKPFSLISWERDVSPLTTNTSSVLSGFHDRSQIDLGFGWVSWENVARWASPQDCWMFKCRTHLIIPSGPIVIVSQWDLWWWSRRHVWFLIQDFSSLQSHNFWNTISWKCSLKDNCIRSSLIEFQSFPNRKIDINPKYRVLMFLPSTMQVLCTTWYREINMCRILMLFVSEINRQEEYCLSLAWILTSRYQSVVDDRMKIKSTSNMVNMMEESTLNYHIVL